MSLDNLNDDDRRFIEAMEAAVAERGADWVYPEAEADPDTDETTFLRDAWHADTEGSCVYQTEDGEPACIIGLAMHKLGLELPPYDRVFGARAALRESSLNLSDTVLAAASTAQAKQDYHATWGDALTAFKEAIAR